MSPQGAVNLTGFCVTSTSCSRLCNALARLPGVRFSSRRRFFVFAANVHAEFIFRDRRFRVQPDPWDGAWWVVPRGEGECLAGLRTLHEQLFSPVTAVRGR